MTDIVNSPPHHTFGGIETIDFLEAKLGAEGFHAYCLGNAIKYIARSGHKGGPEGADLDLRKAIWYICKAREKWREEGD